MSTWPSARALFQGGVNGVGYLFLVGEDLGLQRRAEREVAIEAGDPLNGALQAPEAFLGDHRGYLGRDAATFVGGVHDDQPAGLLHGA